MTIFEFSAHHPEHGHAIARIAADSERAARACLKGMIFARKLTGREAIEVARNHQIIDAETGQVIGEPDADAAQS